MEKPPKLRKVVTSSLKTVANGYSYARHLVQGNRILGDMSWMRDGTRPVILVHGFLGTRGTMQPMTRRLRSDGRVVFSYSFGTFQTRSLRNSSEGLAQHVRRICEELDIDKVDLVGFSMGGLVAMHAVKFLSAHTHVDKLVTLGSPFQGSPLAYPGVALFGAFSPSVWQVVPNSRFLRELATAPMPDGVAFRQIHGSMDFFAPPPGPLPGVGPRDYLILPGGHSTLAVADHVFEAVKEFLDADVPVDTIDTPALHPAAE